MADQWIGKAGLTLGIGEAWAQLEQFLLGLDARQLSACDAAGWTVIDHVTHLAAWEESVARIFEGQPRYALLGVTREQYLEGRIEEINAALRTRWQALSAAEALERLRGVHSQFCALLESISEEQLNATMESLFPQFCQGDDRSLGMVFHGNTEYHFREHLDWMRTLAGERHGG